jgi:hypothetical protein
VSYFQADRIINANDQQALVAAQSDYLSCPDAVGIIAEANAAASQSHQAVNVQPYIAEPVRMLVLKEVEIGFQDTRNTLLILKGLVRRMSAMPGTRAIVMVSAALRTPRPALSIRTQ